MNLAPRGHLQVLPRTECLALLATATVGRLGVSIAALPVILPVNYCLHDDAVVIRTIPGTKLDAATTQAVVAFEVDDHDADGTAGWSVLVQGVAEEVTDPAELEGLQALPLRAWAFPSGEAHRFLRIHTAFISGRSFHVSPSFRVG